MPSGPPPHEAMTKTGSSRSEDGVQSANPVGVAVHAAPLARVGVGRSAVAGEACATLAWRAERRGQARARGRGTWGHQTSQTLARTRLTCFPPTPTSVSSFSPGWIHKKRLLSRVAGPCAFCSHSTKGWLGTGSHVGHMNGVRACSPRNDCGKR